MPRATCRCGETLKLPEDGTDRVVCPRCGAKVRIRINPEVAFPNDGYLRFHCPCGRRLKVRTVDPPPHGQCPDCGRVVPVPARTTTTKPTGHPEADTVDLGPREQEILEEWMRKHGVGVSFQNPDDTPQVASIPRVAETARVEAGMRVCPNCRKPVHLGADVCRECGIPVPRK